MGVKGLYASLLRGLVFCVVTTSLATSLTAAVGSAQSVAVREESASGTRQVLITVKATQAPLAKVLREIARQANLALAFPDGVRQSTARVTVDVHEMPLEQVLAKVLEGSGVKAIVASGAIGFSEAAGMGKGLVAQGSITGKVIDGKTRQGLRGATVSISGTNKGTTTSDDGSFRVSGIVPGSYTIQVRMLGYVKTSKPVTISEGQTASLEIAMQPSVTALDQIVVTGTIVATAQKAVPNAITVITAKEIEQRGITQIDQLFRGEVPGLYAQRTGSSGGPDDIKMFARGGASMLATTTPPMKVYIDGIEQQGPSNNVDTRSIERIEILTGPQAATIYGSGAISGVMQIFTKRATEPRLQTTATGLEGIVQNNLSSSLASQHDYSVQLTDMPSPRMSYAMGAMWQHTGPWVPGRITTRTSGSGSTRWAGGPTTATANIRLAVTKNQTGGDPAQLDTYRVGAGLYGTGVTGYMVAQLRHQDTKSQTLGLNVSVAPVRWWTHALIAGRDQTESQNLLVKPLFTNAADTAYAIALNTYGKTSVRYMTTVIAPLGATAKLTATLGADEWRDGSLSTSTTPSALTGTLTPVGSQLVAGGIVILTTPGTITVSRAVSNNTGAFFQGQLGVWESVFFTYGLRAERNPNYGPSYGTNWSPKYGVAVSRDIGTVTGKVRFAYGIATRPPTAAVKDAVVTTNGTYGTYVSRRASPDLGPESQRGGEGGLELYVANRGSLNITRYNQTVDGLIVTARVDSLASLLPTLPPDTYSYTAIGQNLNLGSIRNQGWELQGTVTTGPLVTKATYSWTKSRIIGIAPQFRNGLVSVINATPGGSIWYLPEHTWSTVFNYTHRRGTASLSLNGTGTLNTNYSKLQDVDQKLRLWNERKRYLLYGTQFILPMGGYTMADLNLAYKLSRAVEGLVMVQNLGDVYRNDFFPNYPSMGRLSKAGVRIRY